MTTKTRRTGKRNKRRTVGRPPPSASRTPRRRPPSRSRGRGGLSTGAKTAVVMGLAVVALGGLYLLNRASGPPRAGDYAYEVGSPGPGQQAPTFDLPSTNGGSVDLASMRGKTVLLYFQEGLTCQPCWDQLVDIEAQMGRFKSLGIDQVVTITTDPPDALSQKVTDEGITTPVLSDPDLAVSQSYDTNSYGMMGNSRNGHSFIVVGPDGTILWRADYGGAPDYTMYVPVESLIADLRQGLQAT